MSIMQKQEEHFFFENTWRRQLFRCNTQTERSEIKNGISILNLSTLTFAELFVRMCRQAIRLEMCACARVMWATTKRNYLGCGVFFRHFTFTEILLKKVILIIYLTWLMLLVVLILSHKILRTNNVLYGNVYYRNTKLTTMLGTCTYARSNSCFES